MSFIKDLVKTCAAMAGVMVTGYVVTTAWEAGLGDRVEKAASKLFSKNDKEEEES